MNFALWAVAILPAWFVVRDFGVKANESVETASPPTEPESGEYVEEQLK